MNDKRESISHKNLDFWVILQISVLDAGVKVVYFFNNEVKGYNNLKMQSNLYLAKLKQGTGNLSKCTVLDRM